VPVRRRSEYGREEDRYAILLATIYLLGEAGDAKAQPLLTPRRGSPAAVRCVRRTAPG
jgi:hypothetical protein